MLKNILKAIAADGITLTLYTKAGSARLNIDVDDNGTVNTELRMRPAQTITEAQPA
ncbi:hypothetical protein SEA_THYATIRA_71 [Mycobacterium phage Thyatira]|uniref:Uncharacterized protein n=2 Tax=Kratiovirus TaxID=2948788 RepID=A0A345M998_9CAUD|nr:hypothetical protein SEA_GENGAR_68 [Mycobacterium phage Gengar]YP_009951060.1 hypothetical protein I5G76_gp30 [Mycobacterium phage Thyatira]AOQ28927.1 hypothetical protein SEA_WATERFOUL_70 [Mycobacterium phage Waterfoul]QXN73812.1 hypothetical protein SEA_SOSEPH_69 [Mycobacterium phage SoSeph]WNM65539.1 hypothetical protein SEA_HEFTYBOY_69 [Mycobacterium phage Heftyboy]AON96723.1 hypothetical protein SEA_GENGAR_68 [Mycobacterium phage Gengar]AXH67069.1 hypothetical protein SEA_THYATIRA_71 